MYLLLFKQRGYPIADFLDTALDSVGLLQGSTKRMFLRFREEKVDLLKCSRRRMFLRFRKEKVLRRPPLT